MAAHISGAGLADGRCPVCRCASLAPVGAVDGYRFLECPRCRFVFTPDVEEAALGRAYARGYHGPADGAPGNGWATRATIEPILARLPRRPLEILDFGTGQSTLPDLLRGEGHRVVGVDVAPPTRPHPDRLTGSLFDLPLDAGRFDLVYAFQVFEHLPEPRPYLDALVRLLHPGGALFIHTDMEVPEREAGVEQWAYAAPPDHCALYRHETFRVYAHAQRMPVVAVGPHWVALGRPPARP